MHSIKHRSLSLSLHICIYAYPKPTHSLNENTKFAVAVKRKTELKLGKKIHKNEKSAQHCNLRRDGIDKMVYTTEFQK